MSVGVEVTQRKSSSTATTSSSWSALFSDFKSAMPTQVSVYEKIGVGEDDIAVDVDPEDVLRYLGTRDELVDKVLRDIPTFDEIRANEEVSKFLLDSDAIKVYIEFQKRRAIDPSFTVPTDPNGDNGTNGLFSLRNVALVYLGYVIITGGPKFIHQWVTNRIEAGEWTGTGIPALDEWLVGAQ